MPGGRSECVTATFGKVGGWIVAVLSVLSLLFIVVMVCRSSGHWRHKLRADTRTAGRVGKLTDRDRSGPLKSRQAGSPARFPIVHFPLSRTGTMRTVRLVPLGPRLTAKSAAMGRTSAGSAPS